MKQMENDTILFKGNNICRAFGVEWFHDHFEKIIPTIQETTQVFYKYREKWFDLRRSFKEIHGFLREKYFTGKSSYPLSPLLTEIPQTIYTDESGYIYNLPPRDGKSDFIFVNLVTEGVGTYDVNVGVGDVMVVDWTVSVLNSIISLNGLFEPYSVISDNRIRYGPDIPGDRSNPNSNLVRVTQWKGVVIELLGSPTSRQGEWLTFDFEIPDTALLFYNGVYYRLEKNYLHPNKLRILDLDLGSIAQFTLPDIKVYWAYHKNPEIQIFKLEDVGNASSAINGAMFNYDITNSLVVYNGVHHEYTVGPDGRSVTYAVPEELEWFNPSATIVAVSFVTYSDL